MRVMIIRHLSNPENILKKMVDSVKENGLVICIEPSRRLENAGIYVDDKYPGADGFLAARCHVISYGYK